MTATETAHPFGSRLASLGGPVSVASAVSWIEVLRVVTWALYIGGAALLLAMPLNQGLLYHAIEPIVLIPNHLLMGAVYTTWFALGMALILWRRNGESSLTGVDGLLLVVVLNLVYTGKWVLNAAPFPAAEGFYYGGDMAYITRFGHISDLQIANLGSYTSFPGLALLGTATHLFSGLTIQQSTVLLQFVHGAALPALMFVLLLTVLRSPAMSAAGTLVFLLGNVGVARWGDSFHPTIWGFLFLALLLLMLARTVFASDRLREALLLTLLVFSMTAEHFISSLISVGIVGAAFLAAPRIRSAVSWELVAMCATAVVAWQLFIAKLYFTQLVLAVRDTALTDTLYWLRLAAATHVTGIPRWAQGVWLFWGLLTFIIPGLVGLWRMPRILWLSRWDRFEVLGLIATVSIVALMTSGGSAGSQYHRLLLYMPFLTVPIVIRLARDRFSDWRWGIAGAAMLVALAYPTFLVQHYAAANDAWQLYELAPLDHLAAQGVLAVRPVAEISPAWLVGLASASSASQSYTGGDRRRMRTETELLGQQAPETTVSLRDYVLSFANGEISPAYFVYVPSRVAITYRQRFGEEAFDATGWQDAFAPLSRVSRVYDNGAASLYFR